MAKPGRKSTPAHLKVVTGNPGKRPIVEDPAADVPSDADNGLDPCGRLLKSEKDLWDRFIRRATWLTDFDVPAAYKWVKLQAEFIKKPGDMVASRIAQIRALENELGLNPSSRQYRSGTSGKKESKDPADEFF